MPELSVAHIELAGRMSAIMRTVRQCTPPSALPSPAGAFFVPTRWDRLPYMQPMLWFATNGCSEYRSTGGCTMCDFGQGDQYSPAEALSALAKVIDRLAGLPLLHLATPRSFFDEAETDSETLNGVLRLLGSRATVRALGIESRPESITAEGLVDTVERVELARRDGPGVWEFAAGLGLEAYDPLIARVAVNKGFDRTAVHKVVAAAERAKALRPSTEFVVETHVLLKPPLITEREAIDDAVRAIEWSLTNGVTHVILMLAATKPGTLSGWLSRHGESIGLAPYTPPSIWSAIEVLAALDPASRERVRVYGLASSTEADVVSSGCPDCDLVMRGAVHEFNVTGKFEAFDSILAMPCACRSVWRDGLSYSSKPLEQRLREAITRIEQRIEEGAQ